MKQDTKYNALWPPSLSSFSSNPLNCAHNLLVDHASQFGAGGESDTRNKSERFLPLQEGHSGAKKEHGPSSQETECLFLLSTDCTHLESRMKALGQFVFESHLSQLEVVWTWANYWTFPCLSFHIYQIEELQNLSSRVIMGIWQVNIGSVFRTVPMSDL